jgi:hypothetical protein
MSLKHSKHGGGRERMSVKAKVKKLGSQELYAIGVACVVIGLILTGLGLYLVTNFADGLHWLHVGLIFVGLDVATIGFALLFIGITLRALGFHLEVDPGTIRLIVLVTIIVTTIASASILAYFNAISSGEYIELVKYVIVTVISALMGYEVGRRYEKA